MTSTMPTSRIVAVRAGILRKNDELAHGLRARFEAAGVFVVNLVSSPGTGKTAFLEWTLTALHQRGVRVAALVGDLETDNDAQRLARSGAPVRQINTHGRCHLEAEMIDAHLDGWALEDIEVLFVENVGNLVCPASYDLGEALRLVLLSVTEGEDKPLKYPTMFNSADIAMVTKSDLAVACEFNREAAEAAIASVRPGMPVLSCSSRTGAGLEDWLALLDARRAEWRAEWHAQRLAAH
ncbi:hydrogenase isoenzymes nickel incorporation protein HypB [Gemmatimonas aurantiaca T-27]|uniref:Hydrogenase isoenzymes nickel incorporation protein HypB n=2 Tax=Gemmatimonas aurantiaca TaxID=173480 RepID=C1A5E8_GEMAT|nr:hydrogenase nickel incorporation protein HypB [Gemmatimonas aurantiaca]BAH37458.1 hydrogenase isoenzymes nickel incorporation protein HypB [Gemmatimonas aurantiaca T-27]